MSDALARLRADVTRDDVVRAVKEYDRLGRSGSSLSTVSARAGSYELVWDKRTYPHKAMLGTAYELATGERLAPADFEGGKAGAVTVLRNLGFTVREKE